MLNLNSILLFSENPQALVEFYSKIFGKEPEWSGGDFSGWKIGEGVLTIGPHDKVQGKNANPERMMLNFETEEVKGEFDRIKSLGAAVVSEPYQPGESPELWIATFSDPDNNYFQLVSPMKM